MNTPSKEALDAAENVQDYLGFPRRATMDLAAIIDRHFEQLRQRSEQAEAHVEELEATCAELVTDGNALTLAANLAKQSQRAEQAEARVKELAGALQVITDLLSKTVKDFGGCDHSVGVCMCEEIRACDNANNVLARHAARKEVQP